MIEKVIKRNKKENRMEEKKKRKVGICMVNIVVESQKIFNRKRMEMIWRENEFRRMGGDIGEMEEMVMRIEMIE